MNDQPLSVSALLARARANDARQLDHLFAACRNYLAILARSHVEGRLRAKIDASDLVQQTMLEAYRDFQRFRGSTEGEWLAWLKQILHHNAANFVRQYAATGKRQLSREVAVDQLAGSSAGPGANGLAANDESPSQALVREEEELLLADALALLPDDYREVICLRNLQRLPFQEVAERMGRSRPAVQMLWGRAIERLQEVVRGLKGTADQATR